MAKLSGKYEAI